MSGEMGMNDSLTSRDEAARIRDVLETAAAYLESAGFDRGQIGAAMMGAGGGMLAKHSGDAKALSGCASLRDAIQANLGLRQ